MTISQTLAISATWGAAFAGLFTAVLFIGALLARDAMLNDYPPSIRDAYGKPQSARGRRAQGLLGLLMMVSFVLVAFLGVQALRSAAGGDIGFWPAFALGATMMLLLHAFDLLVLDWFVLGVWQPDFVVLPGTKGHPAYRDFSFHLHVLFPKPVPWPILLIPVTGIVLGGVTLLAQAIW